MIEVLVDGKRVPLSPRRAEMVRQLLEADARVDTIVVGEVKFRVAHSKVNMRIEESFPPGTAESWKPS